MAGSPPTTDVDKVACIEQTRSAPTSANGTLRLAPLRQRSAKGGNPYIHSDGVHPQPTWLPRFGQPRVEHTVDALGCSCAVGQAGDHQSEESSPLRIRIIGPTDVAWSPRSASSPMAGPSCDSIAPAPFMPATPS